MSFGICNIKCTLPDEKVNLMTVTLVLYLTFFGNWAKKADGRLRFSSAYSVAGRKYAFLNVSLNLRLPLRSFELVLNGC